MQNNHRVFAGETQALAHFLKPFFSAPGQIFVLCFGDVVGQPGRKMIKRFVPFFREQLALDFVLLNAENLAGGFGITLKTFDEMSQCGVDVMTMGNHWRDKPDVHIIKQQKKNMVLPQNLMSVSGVDILPEFYLEKHNKWVHVINLMGNFAMKEEYHNPFLFLEKHKEELLQKRLSGTHLILADIHAEATSEKQAMAWYCNGVFAAQIGSHTHVPTSDERILSGGTAFISDVGMTGAYQSVTGMDIGRILNRCLHPEQKSANEVATLDLWICGFLVAINAKTGLASACARIQGRGLDDTLWTARVIFT